MNTQDSKSRHRFWYWLTLVPLVVAASLTFLEYGWWSAVYSAYYGLPSEAWRLKEAGPKDFYWWMFTGLALTAIIVATILIPPFKSEYFSPGFRGMSRFLLAVIIVAGSIYVVVYGLSAAGHYLKWGKP
jgi:hypothetical protein